MESPEEKPVTGLPVLNEEVPISDEQRRLDLLIPQLHEEMPFDELVRIADECGFKIEDSPLNDQKATGPHRIMFHMRNSTSKLASGDVLEVATVHAIRYLKTQDLFKTTAQKAMSCIEETCPTAPAEE
jgi:hypothetical protein